MDNQTENLTYYSALYLEAMSLSLKIGSSVFLLRLIIISSLIIIISGCVSMKEGLVQPDAVVDVSASDARIPFEIKNYILKKESGISFTAEENKDYANRLDSLDESLYGDLVNFLSDKSGPSATKIQAQLLYRLNRNLEADKKLAILLTGEDDGVIFMEIWNNPGHDDGHEFLIKRLINIHKNFTSNSKGYTQEEKSHFLEFFCYGLFDDTKDDCTEERVSKKINELEYSKNNIPKHIVAIWERAEIQETLSENDTDDLYSWLDDNSESHNALLLDFLETKNSSYALTFKAGNFYELGDTYNGDSLLGEMFINGNDLSGFAWSWMHSGEAYLMDRRLFGIAETLIDNFGSYEGTKKNLVKQVVCDIAELEQLKIAVWIKLECK